MQAGISPARWFIASLRATREVQEHKLSGILPEKLFIPRSMASSLWSLEKLRVEISPAK